MLQSVIETIGDTLSDSTGYALQQSGIYVAQMSNSAGSNIQSPVTEGSQYHEQLHNQDLSPSQKPNTQSGANNQPGQQDSNNYNPPAEQPTPSDNPTPVEGGGSENVA